MAIGATTLTYLALASTAVSTAATVYAQSESTKSANEAAKKQAEARKALLERKASDERNALRENSRRRMAERRRRLSEVRAHQAASGFANSGTQLAVFGEIQSRLDDELDEATSQGLDRISHYNETIRMDRFATDMGISQRNREMQYNNAAAIWGGTTRAASGYYNNYQQSGSDPFSLFA